MTILQALRGLLGRSTSGSRHEEWRSSEPVPVGLIDAPFIPPRSAKPPPVAVPDRGDGGFLSRFRHPAVTLEAAVVDLASDDPGRQARASAFLLPHLSAAAEMIEHEVSQSALAFDVATAFYRQAAFNGYPAEATVGLLGIVKLGDDHQRAAVVELLGTIPPRPHVHGRIDRPETRTPKAPSPQRRHQPESPPDRHSSRVSCGLAVVPPVSHVAERGAPPPDLNTSIETVLRSGGPLRAREIARILRHQTKRDVSRREVNQVLYAHLDRFWQNEAWAWSIAGSQPAIPPPQPPRPAPPRSRTTVGSPAPQRPERASWPPDARLYPWQRLALTAWADQGRRGIIEAVTGSGKTRVGLGAIKAHIDRGNSAVVIVPTIALMDQWCNELAAWLDLRPASIGRNFGGSRDGLGPGRVSVYVVNTAVDTVATDVEGVRRRGQSVLLVADECHRYGAETFRGALEARFDATLGLSATPERGSDYGMEEAVIPAVGGVCFRYGYEEALRDGVIADFEVGYVGLPFDDDERVQYEQLSGEIAKAQQALLQRYPRLRGRKLFAELHVVRRATEDPLIDRYLQLVGQRKTLLMEAEARAEFAEWLIRDARHGQRTFLFHETIEGAEWLAETLRDAEIPASAHHSGMTGDERDAVLQAFRSGALMAITAARTLDEGIDVPDASVGVIVAGSTVRRQRIQRVGRVLRARPGKRAVIVICYVTGARDDPHARMDPDEFHAQMSRLGRVQEFQWPAMKDVLRTWMVEGSRSSGPVPPSPAAVAKFAKVPDNGRETWSPERLMNGQAPTYRNTMLPSLGLDYELTDSGPG